MFVFSLLLFSCTLFFCDAAFVDNLTKCSIKDKKCVIEAFQKIINDIGETGIPEFDIVPIDPMNIKNVSVNVLDAVTLTITDGVIKGFKTCEVKKFNFDTDKQLEKQQIYCNVLTIKGQFVFGGSSPLLQNLFGGTSVNGNGKAKIKLEQVTMNLELPFSIIKKDDGDTYLQLVNKPKYSYDLQKAVFDIKNLVIGDTDISQAASTYLNSNWKTLIQSFGKTFVDKGLEYFFLFARKLYDNIPTKLYIEEDLMPYVSN
ncbi:unnamed protein product [Euphydryas editha]|uniref:Uncharacterized protein n=1 Tax=Euphydryas editha TaxID=104508 RepID=A0AAU9TH92_EUPED|nr:unnamed protein product [Euphydryas editha]CAH2084856.1 unnamed protein product [Euphydryas editha]